MNLSRYWDAGFSTLFLKIFNLNLSALSPDNDLKLRFKIFKKIPKNSKHPSIGIGSCVLIQGRTFLSYKKNLEEVGFEPTIRFHVYTLSKRAPSAARTLLQVTTPGVALRGTRAKTFFMSAFSKGNILAEK